MRDMSRHPNGPNSNISIIQHSLRFGDIPNCLIVDHEPLEPRCQLIFIASLILCSTAS